MSWHAVYFGLSKTLSRAGYRDQELRFRQSSIALLVKWALKNDKW